jgi:hypothetical protein
MRCKYPERDLSQRLDMTVCRYDGHPYYVRYRERGQLQLYDLKSGGKKLALTIDPNDEKFNISTVPLGYVQTSPDSVAYLSRRPNRVYKQGIHSDALNTRFLTPEYRHSFSMISEAFENMVLGQYPRLQDALEVLRRSEIDKEIAIDRNIALKVIASLKLIHVYYKGEVSGWIIPDTSIVVIPSSEMAWVVSKHFEGFSWEVR